MIDATIFGVGASHLWFCERRPDAISEMSSILQRWAELLANHPRSGSITWNFQINPLDLTVQYSWGSLRGTLLQVISIEETLYHHEKTEEVGGILSIKTKEGCVFKRFYTRRDRFVWFHDTLPGLIATSRQSRRFIISNGCAQLEKVEYLERDPRF